VTTQVLRSGKLLMARRDNLVRLLLPGDRRGRRAVVAGSALAHVHTDLPWVPVPESDRVFGVVLDAVSDAAGWELPDYLRK
jgi:hypothetical protein